MNSETPKNHSKTTFPLPAFAVGAALLGGAMFVAGRSSAPNPPANFGTNAAAKTDEPGHAEGEHAEGEHAEGEVEAIVFSPEAMKSAQIEVAPVALLPQLSGLPFSGQIEADPDNVARVASVVSGRVTQLFVSVGARVKRGQTLALLESRGVGEAQAAYAQAAARLRNARSGYDVTQKQARAGVFSRAPLESARRAQIEAQADLRARETAVKQARLALDNASRLAKAGSFARPSLEAARGQYAAALETSKTAQAAQENATAATLSARKELARRQQIAQGGGYGSRPAEEARRVLVAAQAARGAAQSEVSTTRANLNRAQSLAAEGLISTRDLENARNALESAEARLRAASADELATSKDLERQLKLARSGVAGNAEIGEAQARLAQSQADEKTRRAQVQSAREGLRLAGLALSRERAVFGGGIANRREISTARAALENAQSALQKARQTRAVSEAAFGRESSIFRQNLNNSAQIQSARAALVTAQSDFSAAKTTLSLLQSAPGGTAVVPLRAPLDGIVQMRDVAQGEVVEADKNLMTIVNLDTVHVDMNLPERDISRVRLGAPVSVRVDAVPGRVFSGKVELIHTEIDPKTRTVEAHAQLQNSGALRVGMFARGTIGTGKSSLAVMIPIDAVQDMEGKSVVFVASEKSGEFVAREVETGATSGGKMRVKSGLKPGESIVIKGAFMVKAQAMKAELSHSH